MTMEGMDVGEVESLGHQLMNQGNTIQTVINAIDGIVNTMESVWKGHDATEFMGWWQSQHRPALENVESAVHGLGQSALNNAQQQIDASGMMTAGVLVGAAAVGVAAGAAGSSSQVDSPGPGASWAPIPSVGELSGNHLFHVDGAPTTYTQWCVAHGYSAANGTNPGECAAYAAFRRAQLGLSLPSGNGADMAASVGKVPYTQASVGSLISSAVPSPYGHVMVVEKVESMNPPTFRVSEMNAAGQSVTNLGDNHAVINPDNYRTNTVFTLQNNRWVIDRTIVDGQGGPMPGIPLSDVAFSKGLG